MFLVQAKEKDIAMSDTHSPSQASAHKHPTALLVTVCLAQLMVILDISIVNVALPAIHKGLHFSTTDLQWVVNAYTITFAGFLLLGGRASDLLGRRSVFIAGTAMFVIASLLCALANSRGLLIGARALQGLGGAVISPASLAIIATYFKEGKERSRALGAWAATGGAGGAVGVILGGVLTQGFGWPAIFIVNVPIGIGVIISTRMVVAPGGAVQGRRDFDLSPARCSSRPRSPRSCSASCAPTRSAGAPPECSHRSPAGCSCSPPSSMSRAASRARRSCHSASFASPGCARPT
jgi:MFS family permease